MSMEFDIYENENQSVIELYFESCDQKEVSFKSNNKYQSLMSANCDNKITWNKPDSYETLQFQSQRVLDDKPKARTFSLAQPLVQPRIKAKTKPLTKELKISRI